MRHSSIKLETPCEFINITPVNPLISKCEIKVCWVGDDANRNKSIITKDVAIQMANSLPGSPIVGYYNEDKEDFEEHNRIIEIKNGKFKLKDTTRPYGFVDLNAKVWYQKFLDDGTTEREYLMTEGYLWTGQYPEARRIVEGGNNQSMELDEKFLDATWTKDINGNRKFFIINEAIISKLCILGDEEEPCFEGSTITKPTINFSFDEDFKVQMFKMMEELKNLITEGGTPMFASYAVEIGDALWHALYSFLEVNFAEEECEYPMSKYYIDSIWEEGAQKFAILRDRKDSKYFRLNFIYNDEGFSSDGVLTEVEKTYVPVTETPVFSLEDIEKFEAERYAQSITEEEEIVEEVASEEEVAEPEESVEPEVTEFKEEKEEEEEICPKCEKPVSECTCDEEEEKKDKYSLEEIPEYVELLSKYEAMETELASVQQTKDSMAEELANLRAFKAEIDLEKKQEMVNSFYMLSDEDKKEVVDNISNYSLDEIEAKLSIICVRNKVNFNLEKDIETAPTTYNVNNENFDSVPAWVKSVQSVAKELK